MEIIKTKEHLYNIVKALDHLRTDYGAIIPIKGDRAFKNIKEQLDKEFKGSSNVKDYSSHGGNYEDGVFDVNLNGYTLTFKLNK